MTVHAETLPPLVLMHGFLSDHSLWDGVLAKIRMQRPVLAPDLPGFGSRKVLDAEPSIEALADDLASNLKAQGFTRVILGGMSLGGYVALAFAERHRSMLAGLALISTHAAADSPARQRFRRITIAAVRRKGVGAAVGEYFPLLFAPGRRDDPALVQIASDAARQSSSEGVCWTLEAMARRPDRSKLLQDLPLPVLVVHGTEDQVIPIERAREMAAIPPKADFVEIPGCGHASPWEAPSELAAALSSWLQGFDEKTVEN